MEEGDRQAPEGFYTVTPAQMNPNSNYYLSFNIGYPNAYDRSLGRTGSNLMVHGACSSAGCYSMTDEDAGEIFALARDAFRGGQRAFQIQAFPFRMTPENMARHRDDPNMDFWRMLKDGYDTFELTRVPPKVDVCDRRYVFNADAGRRQLQPDGRLPALHGAAGSSPPRLSQAGRGRRQVRPGRRHASTEAAGGGGTPAGGSRTGSQSVVHRADARRQAASRRQRRRHAGRAAQGRGFAGAAAQDGGGAASRGRLRCGRPAVAPVLGGADDDAPAVAPRGRRCCGRRSRPA